MLWINRKSGALNKELALVRKQEQRMEQSARNASPALWKTELESRIPPKVYSGLESAFCKGFSLVFRQGRAIIEKSCSRETLQAEFTLRDYAVQLKGGRKELKQLRKGAKQSDFLNLALTTAEGVALGALGVGMPDIVLFLATLLKGVYETAISYGFGYESPREQLLILTMMQTALSTGEDWAAANARTDELLTLEDEVTEETLQQQIQATASVFAMDMLLLKFIQGLPVVGILGGAANPVYYRKVMKYVQLKYRKRYLLMHRQRLA